MLSVYSTAGWMLLVLVLTADEVQGDDCNFMMDWKVSDCFNNLNVNFNDMSNLRDLCRNQRPTLETCIGAIRKECEQLASFQGAKGQALDTLLASFSQFCSKRSGGPVPGCNQQCPSQSEKAFFANLDKCHEPLGWNLKHGPQMCGPLSEVSGCLRNETLANRRCEWMTYATADRVLFQADYYKAERFIKHDCKD